MDHINAVAAMHPRWVSYAIPLLVSALPWEILLVWLRGFGRRGFGGRRFGRGFGSFRLIRVLFVLMFTTVLGPIVLVALVAFIAYRFYISRRGR
jgi:hypothetical protein